MFYRFKNKGDSYSSNDPKAPSKGPLDRLKEALHITPNESINASAGASLLANEHGKQPNPHENQAISKAKMTGGK